MLRLPPQIRRTLGPTHTFISKYMAKQASGQYIGLMTLNEERKYNVLSFSTTILPKWKVLYLRILLILRKSNKQFPFFTKYSKFIKSLIFNIYIWRAATAVKRVAQKQRRLSFFIVFSIFIRHRRLLSIYIYIYIYLQHLMQGRFHLCPCPQS